MVMVMVVVMVASMGVETRASINKPDLVIHMKFCKTTHNTYKTAAESFWLAPHRNRKAKILQIRKKLLEIDHQP